MSNIRTRFAPSPTGFLHLGHAYSALSAYDYAAAHGGTFILRIEDIDPVRCKTAYVEAIYEDLAWLGLSWEEPVRVQSHYYEDYKHVIERLDGMGVLYPCFCTRKEILEEVERAGYAPHGPEGTLYPGTCRGLSEEERRDRIARGDAYALRLDLTKALSLIPEERLFWMEHGHQVPAKPKSLRDDMGDIVIARKDIGTSYHLSVVTDDALQGITHIIRGQDLKYATPIHRVLQELLGFPAPDYRHHALLKDAQGRRFAKRDKSQTIRSYRASGMSAEALKSRFLGY